MSKTALLGLTKVLAQEVGSSGIRVNCIAPGVIDTKFSSMVFLLSPLSHFFSALTLFTNFQLVENETIRDKILEGVPLQRFISFHYLATMFILIHY